MEIPALKDCSRALNFILMGYTIIYFQIEYGVKFVKGFVSGLPHQ